MMNISLPALHKGKTRSYPPDFIVWMYLFFISELMQLGIFAIAEQIHY